MSDKIGSTESHINYDKDNKQILATNINLHNRIKSILNGIPADINKITELVSKYGFNHTAITYSQHYDYNHHKIAGRLLNYFIEQSAAKNIPEYIERCQDRLHPKVINFMLKYVDELHEIINSVPPVEVDYFNVSTFISLHYLFRPPANDFFDENIKYCILRRVVYFHGDIDSKNINEIFKIIKNRFTFFYHQFGTSATPTIQNAGTIKPQMSSCILMSLYDNLESILHRGCFELGMASKYNCGIGIDLSNLRHSDIGFDGKSKGLSPVLHIINAIARYVDQGGKRKGAVTVSLRPQHIDIQTTINTVKKVGDKYDVNHDIGVSVWTNWVFWERVKSNKPLTLFCPNKTKALNRLSCFEYKAEYEKLELLATQKAEELKVLKLQLKEIQSSYGPLVIELPEYQKLQVLIVKSEKEQITSKSISAKDLLTNIAELSIKSGSIYIMNGDAANFKSNHKNLGYIPCANLCQEITQYQDSTEIASCNLGSNSVVAYVKSKYIWDYADAKKFTLVYDFQRHAIDTRNSIYDLYKVIKLNWYPLDERDENGNVIKRGPISRSNLRHQPVALGVSGFSNALRELNLPFDDIKDRKLPDARTKLFNKMYFACMYFNAVVESIRLSILYGPYESINYESNGIKAPLSEGKLAFDLWREEYELLSKNGYKFKFRKPEDDIPIDPKEWGQSPVTLPNGYVIEPTWNSLSAALVLFKAALSHLLAIMPTASTSQIIRNTEACDAPQTNLYSRKAHDVSAVYLDRHLYKVLDELKLWDEDIGNYIAFRDGSISDIDLYIKYMQKSQNKYLHFNDWDKLESVKHVYRTSFEISQRVFITLAADRSRYLDNAHSLNINLDDPTPEKVIACIMQAEDMGLKNILYYVRALPSGRTARFTSEAEMGELIKQMKEVSVANERSQTSKENEMNNEKNKVSERSETNGVSKMSEANKDVCEIRRINGVPCVSCT